MEKWLICAGLSAVFAGLTGIFGKIGVKDIDSSIATTARSLIMSAFLVVVMCSRGPISQLGTIPAKSWLFVALAGLAGALSWLFFFEALKEGDASRVASIDRLSLVVTAVLAWLLLGEKVSLTVVLGLALIVGGALLVTKG
ncbi:MAG: EamA family transporter [Candidatus Obscuribacterales bacterium]|nr:EamA family transporter [Candidatus Obscuribacterales bacterium]